MKVVFDTNVLVSALITNGKPKELFHKAAVERQFHLIVSKNILEEFIEVSKDPKIRKYIDPRDTIAFLKIIDTVADVIKVKSRFRAVTEDPADDVILRTAFDCKADCIVSGYKHLLSLGAFRGIRILTVNEMLEFLKEEKTQK